LLNTTTVREKTRNRRLCEEIVRIHSPAYEHVDHAGWKDALRAFEVHILHEVGAIRRGPLAGAEGVLRCDVLVARVPYAARSPTRLVSDEANVRHALEVAPSTRRSRASTSLGHQVDDERVFLEFESHSGLLESLCTADDKNCGCLGRRKRDGETGCDVGMRPLVLGRDTEMLTPK